MVPHLFLVLWKFWHLVIDIINSLSNLHKNIHFFRTLWCSCLFRPFIEQLFAYLAFIEVTLWYNIVGELCSNLEGNCLKSRVFLDEVNALAFLVSLKAFCLEHFSELFLRRYLSEGYVTLSVSMDSLKVFECNEYKQTSMLEMEISSRHNTVVYFYKLFVILYNLLNLKNIFWFNKFV